MKRPAIPLEELLRLVPDLEDLDDLRNALTTVAAPDPAWAWSRSRSLATVDKRIVAAEGIETSLEQSEARLHGLVSSLFLSLRDVFRAYFEGDSQAAATRLIEIGERLESGGRLRDARRLYQNALELTLPLPDKEAQVLALRRIGRVAFSLGELHDAWLHYRRSADLARDVGAVRSEVTALTGCGNVLLMQGRWPETADCYRGALERLESAGQGESLRLERAQLFNNLGMIGTLLEALDEAEEWFRRAMEEWSVIDSPVDLAICHFNQGHLRERQNRFEAARQAYGRALECPVPSALRATFAIDLAECFLKEGEMAEAEHWGRVAEEHAIAARSPYHLGHMYRGLGNISRERGDADGFVFFEKALQIARERGFRPMEAEALVDYALLRARMGEEEEAVSYLERAREICSELGIVHEGRRADELLDTLERSKSEASSAVDGA